MIDGIKVIAFDADDTLWINEPYFREAENRFCELLEGFLPHHQISHELYKTEMQNLELYGYGVKGFVLCMIETASRITNHQANINLVNQIIQLGQDLLQKPIKLLYEVEETLSTLKNHYKLIVATKGDLLDQEKKLEQSGLEQHFHHIEIMSNKRSEDYCKLLKHLDCEPQSFMMIGNSLKSDVIPVIEIGGIGVHIPYRTTWEHEQVDHNFKHDNFLTINDLSEVVSKLIG